MPYFFQNPSKRFRSLNKKPFQHKAYLDFMASQVSKNNPTSSIATQNLFKVYGLGGSKSKHPCLPLDPKTLMKKKKKQKFSFIKDPFFLS
jgi:hypothetical protein